MKLPLSEDTKTVLIDEKYLPKASNLGLILNKYIFAWSDNWELSEKTKFLEKFADIKAFKSVDTIKPLLARQEATLQKLKSSGWHIEPFTATTDSRLIIGLGGTSVIETGMTLHPLYGFPYLPGSGLKGLARAYAEIAVDPKPSADELRDVFGSEDKNPHNVANNRQGKVFFMDGLPTQFPKLELDIMNPHYGEYYRGEKPPADYLNPVPVTFLAIAAEQGFSFAIYSRDKALVEKAKRWLIGGLTELGAGGKTNVGYGYFKDAQSTTTSSTEMADSITSQSSKVKQETDNSLAARLKSVKNQETFAIFVKGIKENEFEALKDITFKGMESVINIGLAGVLETIEASAEIKKIIALKMLEVCKEPDKKYAEKLEKYKKLQAIAGKA